MAVALECISIVIRIDAIRKLPGGWEDFIERYPAQQDCWYDADLFRMGAMNPMEAEMIIDELKSLGLKGFVKRRGKSGHWQDFCALGAFTTELDNCDWLELGEGIVWLKGSKQTRVVAHAGNRTGKRKKRRGSAIVADERGVLLVQDHKQQWLLPGGHANRSETRFMAAIRELEEETGLQAWSAQCLFEYESEHYMHQVVLIKANGIPKPSDDAVEIGYVTAATLDDKLPRHSSTWHILDRYFQEVAEATI